MGREQDVLANRQNVLMGILHTVTFFRPPYFLAHFVWTSKSHKIITKRRRDILRPVLESPRSILFKNHICINKFLNFDVFFNGLRVPMSGFGGKIEEYRSGCKKC